MDKDKIEGREAIDEIILVLLYLARIGNHKNFAFAKDFYAWRGLDFDALDELERAGCLEQGSYQKKNRVMHLTKEGLEQGAKVLEKYGITDIDGEAGFNEKNGIEREGVIRCQ